MKKDSHKELHCKKWEMKQGILIVHTRCNNANNGKSSKEDSLFTQRVTRQTIGTEGRKKNLNENLSGNELRLALFSHTSL
ncbi:hypothetical protein KSS87_023278, partial [Heliosperma pusillum]